MRYGHAPADECPLCHMPDSCTHFACECPDHEALRITRHNAACQLLHAAIRKTARRGGALHSAPDLVIVMADTGTRPMTTGEYLDSLSSTAEDNNPCQKPETRPHDWLAPLPTSEDTRYMRHTDVSQDPKYNHGGLSAADGDAECTTALRRMPDWVLLPGETQTLFQAGHGTAPDLIYARGVLNSPFLDPTSFNKKQCTLIIVEIGFCMDLGCDIMIEKNREILPPHCVPQKTLGTGGVHYLSHWPRGYHVHQDPRPPHRRLLHRPTKRGEITGQQGRR